MVVAIFLLIQVQALRHGSCTFSITQVNHVGRIKERSDGSADARGFGGSASLDPPYSHFGISTMAQTTDRVPMLEKTAAEAMSLARADSS